MNTTQFAPVLYALAAQSLPLWGLPTDSRVSLLNVSENSTYLVETPDNARFVLRVHRTHYHADNAIQSELDWIRALRDDADVKTPQAITGLDDREIQTNIVDGLPAPRRMVLFHYIEGTEPEMDGFLIEPFRRLGVISARSHLHSLDWQRPTYFERLVWDIEGVFGRHPYWGRWQDGPLDDLQQKRQLEKIERCIRERLGTYGTDPERFGLAHCDLRLGNLLLNGDETQVIDFDDCGLSWFMYDLATAMTLIDNQTNSAQVLDAALSGYQQIRPLTNEDLAILSSLMMLRRLALIAWFGSHPDVEMTHLHGAGFARETCEIGETYVSRTPSPDELLPWL